MDLLDAGSPTLLTNPGREIDFIMRRSNTRAQLSHHAGRLRAKLLLHQLNGPTGDVQLGPFPT